MKKRVVYIIPTYNESENIKDMLALVDSIFKKLTKYEYKILVVDDTSPDGTGDIVKKISSKNRKIILLSGKKEGLGAAVIRGLVYAQKKLSADYVVTNEADFSYSPKEIPKILKKLDSGWDVVAGSRRITNLSSWPKYRLLIHFLANDLFAKIVAGVTLVEDHNSAYKALNVNNVVKKLDFSRFPKGFSFFNYLIYASSELTDKIYEFKTDFKPRTKGTSKISLNPKYIKHFARDSVEYMTSCIRIRLEKLNLL